MAKARIREKGIVLFIVLATVFITILLANIILNIISNQSRLTHHQISRIQAYYAAQAAMNFALEKLRKGTWYFTDSPASNSCPDTSPPTCLVPDTSFPHPIQSVKVVFCPEDTIYTGSSTACSPPAGTGIKFCVNSTVTYTSAP